jgi:two-component system sensor histidine kinase KdpD
MNRTQTSGLGPRAWAGALREMRVDRSAGPIAVHVRSFFLATVACAATLLVADALLRVFALSNVVMLFFVTVVCVALTLGRAAAVWAAMLCASSLDFFFVEPRLSFAMSDTQYLFTFALMLVVALLTGQLAIRLRTEAKVANAGERRASAIALVAAKLYDAIKAEQITSICNEMIGPNLQARVALVLPDPWGRLAPGPDADFIDLSVAQWVFDQGEKAGLGTRFPGVTDALYLPLKAPMAPRGVLVVRPDTGALSCDPNCWRVLDASCSFIALALERIHLVRVAHETSTRMEGQRLRNALLASVSHDLKTPLTAIRGLAETLEDPDGLAAAEQADLARSIRMQAEELQRLVANLLDAARMQSQGVQLNKKWHSVWEVIESALARSESALGARYVRVDLAEDLPLVELDGSLIERVLVNLLDNAAKYAGADATIQIRAVPSGNSMSLFVEDDGVGLPTSDTETLFEPFIRGQKESSIAGVGLGLALCRSIVAAHGGEIHARTGSQPGASFEFRLPLGSPPEIECGSAA